MDAGGNPGCGRHCRQRHTTRREPSRADSRFGSIEAGREANLLLVDGDPLADISVTERISLVVFRGERVRRNALFEQK